MRSLLTDDTKTPEETAGLLFLLWLLDKAGKGNHIISSKNFGDDSLVMKVTVKENGSFTQVSSSPDFRTFTNSVGMVLSQPVIGAITLRSVLPSGNDILRGWMCLGGRIVALNEQQLLDGACAGENGKILSPETHTEYARAWEYSPNFIF